ncbi:MAG: carbohydrate binding domain-containing protein [Armatimonadetes bacterium]|nr:carbohydrate binding domain-containing protein [Armatimonadota bacterium]
MQTNRTAALRATRISIVTLVAVTLSAYASGGNLLLDGSSFETGYDGFSSLLAYAWTKHGLAGSDPRRGVLDTTTAAHGKCSLQMYFHPPYGLKGFSPWCTFRWIKIKEGQKYTVSLYAKAARDGQKLTVSVSDAWQDWGWSFFTLTTKWERYSHQITVGKTEGGYAWVLIPFPEDGTVWIDGVQLEEGELTGYAPGRGIDLGVNCNYPTKYENLFFAGDKVVLTATVFSDLTEKRNLVLQYSVEDFFGQTPFKGTMQLMAMPKATTVKQINLGAMQRGSYKATLRLLDKSGELQDCEELIFGVIKRRQAEPNIESQFGTHGFPHPVLETCGVRWVRTYLLAWPAVEPEEGRFSWPEEREEDRLFLKNLDQHKINALPVLQSAPAWALSDQRPHGGWSKEQSEAVRLPRMDAWRRYVFAVVSRYKGQFKYWEVMNEPTAYMNADDYIPFLKATYEEAKRADPNCKIVAGDTAWKNTPFFKDLLDKGALEFIDVFCGHFYGIAQAGPPEVKYGREDAGAVVAFLREGFRAHGKPEMEIWNTEEGTYVPPWYSKEIIPKSREPWHRVPNVRRQATDMVRSHLIELGNGIRKVFWFYELYSEQAADARWIIRPEGMYGIEYDGAPRPALIAYSVLTEKLEGAKPFGREVNLDDKVHCFVFAKGAGSVATVWYWGEEGKDMEMVLPPERRLQVFNMMGNPVRAAQGGETALHLDGNPLYLEPRGLSAQDLFTHLTRARIATPK